MSDLIKQTHDSAGNEYGKLEPRKCPRNCDNGWKYNPEWREHRQCPDKVHQLPNEPDKSICLTCSGQGGTEFVNCPDCGGTGSTQPNADTGVRLPASPQTDAVTVEFPTGDDKQSPDTKGEQKPGRRIGGVPVTKAIERLGRLERRAEWLEDRVGASTKDLAFDKGEASALRWAVAVITEILLP